MRSDSFSTGPWILVGTGLSVACVVMLHLLQPHRSPVSSPPAAYVLGRGGFGTVLAFLTLALALSGAAVGAAQTLAPGRVRTGTVLLLGLGAVAATLGGIVPTEGAVPPALPITGSGWVHVLAVGAFACLTTAGAGAFTVATKLDDRWRTARPFLLASLGLCTGALLLTPVAGSLGAAGLTQRIFLIALAGWLLTVGVRIRAIRRGPVPGPRILARVE